MTLRDSVLGGEGVASDRLACYGMPHVMAHYTGGGVNDYAKDEGAVCMFCGRVATDAHHLPPKSTAHTILLRNHVLRPALVALCRECHEAMHAGMIEMTWAWDSDDARSRWESGEWLDHGVAPHDSWLYSAGRWSAFDWRNARTVRWRGTPADIREGVGGTCG